MQMSCRADEMQGSWAAGQQGSRAAGQQGSRERETDVRAPVASVGWGYNWG
jgi:hypothetical protein